MRRGPSDRKRRRETSHRGARTKVIHASKNSSTSYLIYRTRPHRIVIYIPTVHT